MADHIDHGYVCSERSRSPDLTDVCIVPPYDVALELKAKVSLCGEDKAALPIKVEDAAEGLNLEFVQMVPGSKDIEGRQVRGKDDCFT